MVSDDRVNDVVQAILRGAKTGKIGDGKILISHIEQAIRIRTDERGDAAV